MTLEERAAEALQRAAERLGVGGGLIVCRLSPDAAAWLARAVIPLVLEEAAKMAETRHEAWAEDDGPEVICDVTACGDIATAIRALKGGGDVAAD